MSSYSKAKIINSRIFKSSTSNRCQTSTCKVYISPEAQLRQYEIHVRGELRPQKIVDLSKLSENIKLG